MHFAEALERMEQSIICVLPQKLKANGLVKVNPIALLARK